jgi:hypothetical protein
MDKTASAGGCPLVLAGYLLPTDTAASLDRRYAGEAADHFIRVNAARVAASDVL